MQDNKTFFLKDFFSRHLTDINGVNFTRREIDVIACFLNMRGTSKVASILSVSPNTIITHSRNIMQKLGCNSREGILDFIETSGKANLLRQHYSSLCVQSAFGESLKAIKKLSGGLEAIYLLVYGGDRDLKKTLILHLKNDLKQAGIQVILQEEGVVDLLEKGKSVFLILLEKEVDQTIPSALSQYHIIDLSDQENYYFAVFAILKKLLSTIDLKKITDQFQSKWEKRDRSDLCKFSEPIQEKEWESKGIIKFSSALQILTNPKLRFTLIFLLLIVIGLGVIVFENNIGEKQDQNLAHLQDISKEEPELRSDLIIPTEPSFLNRPELITQVETMFGKQKGVRTVALIGPGGAGKTTLARQYAHQQNDKVIWESNAETQGSLRLSFENLAQGLAKTEEDKKELRGIRGIENSTERDQKILYFVKIRLRRNPNWFLIYDNVEKFSEIQQYFPQDLKTWGEGRVILTTRDNNIQLNTHVKGAFQIGELNSSQKLHLFSKIMNQGSKDSFTSSQTEQTKIFLENIPPYPLDVSSAAYYLKATNVSYRTYLENLAQYHKDFENVQENLLKEAGDYAKTRYGIITVSIERLMQVNTDFPELLLLISLLDSQNIPRDLLNQHKASEAVANFIYHLKKYSLITYELSRLPTSFSLHRSTQAIILAYLIKKLDLKKNNKLICKISNTLETYIAAIVKRENYSKMKPLISHYEMFLTHKNLSPRDISASLKTKLGYVYTTLGNYQKAKQHYEEGLLSLNHDQGKNNILAAWTLTHLGQTDRILGNFEKAKDALEKSSVLYEQHFHENQIEFARTLVYLGNVWRDLGDYKKAQSLIEKSIKIFERHLPENQFEFAEALTYLGQVYLFTGNFEKSKELYGKALVIFKRHLPENYFRVAWSLSHIGGIYGELGDYEKAKDVLEKSYNFFKAINREDSDDMAFNLAALSIAYRKLGLYEKAQYSLEKSLIFYQRQCPKYNNRIAEGFSSPKNIEERKFDYKNAEEIAIKSVEVYEKKYGKDHICLARGLWNLSQVYLLQGHMENAEQALNKAIYIFQKNMHPEVHTCLESLADLYLKKSRDAKNQYGLEQEKSFKTRAVSSLIQALKIIKSHFPEDSLNLKRIQSKLNKLQKE